VKSVSPDSVVAMQLESFYATLDRRKSDGCAMRKTITALELSLLEAVKQVWRRGGIQFGTVSQVIAVAGVLRNL